MTFSGQKGETQDKPFWYQSKIQSIILTRIWGQVDSTEFAKSAESTENYDFSPFYR